LWNKINDWEQLFSLLTELRLSVLAMLSQGFRKVCVCHFSDVLWAILTESIIDCVETTPGIRVRVKR